VGEVSGDAQLQTDVLESLSDAHRYRRWLADLIRPYLGADPIEVDSGNGDYTVEWADSVSRFTATEADQDRLAALSERFVNDPVVATRYLMLPAEDAATHSAAVAMNVLEHVPDHVSALRGMADLVRPG